MTDREIVKQLVPLLLLRAVVGDIQRVDGQDRDTWQVCLQISSHLDNAIRDLGVGGTPDDKLRRRGARVAKDVAQHIAGCDFGALVLAYRLLVLRLIERGDFHYVEDSSFDKAWEHLVDGLLASNEFHKLDTPWRRGEGERLARVIEARLRDYHQLIEPGRAA